MNKRDMRKEAVERLKEHINHPGYYRTLIKAIVGDDYDELTVEECDERLIDLLTDDDMDNYMQLPVDDGGEVLHIGDEITYHGLCERHQGKVLEVKGIMSLSEGIDAVVVYDAGLVKLYANNCRHYHKPTVEDVLRELVIACEDAGNAGPAVEALISKHAERLRLKEDE